MGCLCFVILIFYPALYNKNADDKYTVFVFIFRK